VEPCHNPADQSIDEASSALLPGEIATPEPIVSVEPVDAPST
jgi:hypothetical protein